MSKEEREEMFQLETFIARSTILIGLSMLSIGVGIWSYIIVSNPWVG